MVEKMANSADKNKEIYIGQRNDTVSQEMKQK
jgi:hypothetical protein